MLATYVYFKISKDNKHLPFFLKKNFKISKDNKHMACFKILRDKTVFSFLKNDEDSYNKNFLSENYLESYILSS